MEKARQPEVACGLPVLTNAEQEELWDQAFETQDFENDPTDTLIYDIADIAMNSRPVIDVIIDTDIDHLMQDPATDQLSPEDHEQYFRGVTLGYRFIVGCMTYVHYMRDVPDRREMNIDEYVYMLPTYSQKLPLAYDVQKDRMLDSITGEAIVNPFHHMPLPGRRSPCIAENARAFTKDSLLFAAIIEEEESQLLKSKVPDPRCARNDQSMTHNENPGSQPLIDGFNTGVDGCIALYMQSHVQIIIDETEANLLP